MNFLIFLHIVLSKKVKKLKYDVLTLMKDGKRENMMLREGLKKNHLICEPAHTKTFKSLLLLRDQNFRRKFVQKQNEPKHANKFLERAKKKVKRWIIIHFCVQKSKS